MLEKLEALIKDIQGVDRDAFISANNLDEQKTGTVGNWARLLSSELVAYRVVTERTPY